MNKIFHQKIFIFLGILIILFSVVGVSYASWMYRGIQNDFDVVGTKCFNVQMMNESEGIHLDKVVPTKDEEGMRFTPYTFTIKNVCDTDAFYQVNLEELVLDKAKKLSGEYIKVSLNDSNGKNLDTYEEVGKTLENADVKVMDGL